MKTSTPVFASVGGLARRDGCAMMLGLVISLYTPLLSAEQTFVAGTPDTNFASKLHGWVESVLMQPDGRLLVTGGFYVGGGSSYSRLVRLTADGAHDPTFTSTSNVPSQILALQPDGKVLVGSEWGLWRLLSDGNIDPAFRLNLPNPDPQRLCCFWCTSVAVQMDGKILAAGYRLYRGSDENRWIAPQVYRLLPDGSLDDTFHRYPATVEKLAVLPDHRILVMGAHVTRLHPDGTVDATFTASSFSAGPLGTPSVQAYAFQADGRILIGGSFTNVGGQNRDRLARLWPDGRLDASFDPPPSTGDGHRITAIVVQSDGRILAGGTFNTIDGFPYAGLVRLNADGSLDSTFPPINGIQEDGEGSVFSVVIQDETRALVGGRGLGTAGVLEVDDLFRIHLGDPAPRLSVSRISSGEVRLTYSYSGTHDFIVLSSLILGLPTVEWKELGSATSHGAGLYEFTIIPTEAHQFFQLRRAAAPPR